MANIRQRRHRSVASLFLPKVAVYKGKGDKMTRDLVCAFEHAK